MISSSYLCTQLNKQTHNKMKTLTSSQFALLVLDTFKDFTKTYNGLRVLSVSTSEHGANCRNVLYIAEFKSGSTKVIINGVNYNKMTAAEKREAFRYATTLPVEKVVRRDLMSPSSEPMEFNLLAGAVKDGEITYWYYDGRPEMEYHIIRSINC